MAYEALTAHCEGERVRFTEQVQRSPSEVLVGETGRIKKVTPGGYQVRTLKGVWLDGVQNKEIESA